MRAEWIMMKKDGSPPTTRGDDGIGERWMSDDREEVEGGSGAINDSSYGIVRHMTIRHSLVVNILR